MDNANNNSVFVLCKQEQVSIERMHICTWNLGKTVFFTEYGFEINRSALKSLDLNIVLPNQGLEKKNFKSLFRNVSDTNNCRFIFNSDIEKTSPINGIPEHGINFDFCKSRKITILPICEDDESLSIQDNTIKLQLSIPQQAYEVIYIRFLLKTSNAPYSFEKGNNFTKKIINYDIRINERRSSPQNVIDLQTKGYRLISIKRCFCFHIIPSSFNIDFVDGKKLKNIRGLEYSGFNNYLGDIKNDENITLKEAEYNIVFCKQEDSENYSFFSVFSKEYIGNNQIIIAITTNIICSLLFAFSSNTDVWYKQWNFLIAIGILIVLLFWLFNPKKLFTNRK